MPRYKLLVEYDGSPYSGWQRQDNAPSVQEEIEKAFHKFCQEDVTLFVAGRTDTGVHALGQVAHVDLEKPQEPNTIRKAINYYLSLSKHIVILDVQEVSEEFHARFGATKRSYVYKVLNRPVSSPLRENRVWHIKHDLDTEAMQEAADLLIGHHDFSTFRATHCQANSPMRTMDKIEITKVDDEIHVFLEATSFLHHQVRNIMGSLKLVGEGTWSVDDFDEAFHAKDRAKGGPTAPSAGLYLVGVKYK